MTKKTKITLFIAIILVAASAILIGYKISHKTSDNDTGLRVREASEYSLGFDSTKARVVDQKGKPVANAIIELKDIIYRDREHSYNELIGWSGLTLITDSDGVFYKPEFPTILNHKVTCSATIKADGFVKRDMSSLYRNHGINTGQVDLLKSNKVSGIFVDSNGNPIPNASLSMRTASRYNTPSLATFGGYDSKTKTDDEGFFKFENIPAGNHIISYPGNGNCQNKASLPVDGFCYKSIEVKDGIDTENVLLTLSESTCSIKGTVLDENQQPVIGAKVYGSKKVEINDKEGSRWASSSYTVFVSKPTDSMGKYEIKNAPSGNYDIRASLYEDRRQKIECSENVVWLRPNSNTEQNITVKRKESQKTASNNHSKNKDIPIEAPILLVDLDTETNTFVWEIEVAGSFRLLHGCYSSENGELTEYCGAGSLDVCSSGKIRLTMKAEKVDNKVILDITRNHRDKDFNIKMKFDAPANTGLLFEEGLDETIAGKDHLTLWKASLMSGDLKVKELAYTIRLVPRSCDRDKLYTPPSYKNPNKQNGCCK